MNSFVNNYERISRFQNKKCFFGIGLYGKMKIFYKEFNTNFDMEKEIEGYSIVKKYYTVPEMLSKIDNTILYEYL